jgi:protein-S-isoprenylcysteine O-methyltransferase Ste14
MHTTWRRDVGIGLVGLIISVGVWSGLLYLQWSLPLPEIFIGRGWQIGLVALFAGDGMITLSWSLLSRYRSSSREELLQSGPYRLIRHPVYAVFLWNGTALTAFIFESWLVLLGAIPLHLLWGWLVQSEEYDLYRNLGPRYLEYCRVTGQFFPNFKNLIKTDQSPPVSE